MAEPFDTLFEELAFLKLETHAVLDKYLCDTVEKCNEMVHVGAPKEDIVNNVFVAPKDGGGDQRFGKGAPFIAEDLHDSGVDAGAVHGSEGKNGVGPFASIGAPESKFFLGERVDGYLVEALHGVEGDEKDWPVGFGETFQSI